MGMTFTKATRKKARLRLTITGPSGSGKTLGALMIAKGIGGQIAVIDTERGSASLYSAPVTLADGTLWQPPEFDVLELDPPYTPERFIEAVDAAEAHGADIIIADSTSHEWSGVGGCLELVDQIAKAKCKGNSWAAWNDVTPRHRAFMDRFLRSQCHVITTTRSKTETAQEERNGKKVVVKLGMKSEQRDGSEFEFTTVVELVHADNLATATKDRTGVFAGLPRPITEDTGRALREWLETGEDAPPPPPPPPPPRMEEGVIADWESAINSSADLGELKKNHGLAVTAARRIGDPRAIDKFDSAKDVRKGALQAKAAAANQQPLTN